MNQTTSEDVNAIAINWVETHGDYLFNFAIGQVRDTNIAEDLVQETFIKVWQRCATFRGESELVPWVRSILRHAILDHLRGRTKEVAMEDETGTVREVELMIAEANGEPATNLL